LRNVAAGDFTSYVENKERFTDLDKLNLVRFVYAGFWYGYWLEPIFPAASAASKDYAEFKSGQKRLLKIILSFH
jgi:hypothetical protein